MYTEEAVYGLVHIRTYILTCLRKKKTKSNTFVATKHTHTYASMHGCTAPHLNNISNRSQPRHIFLSEEGNSCTPLTRPACTSNTVYVRHGRLHVHNEDDKNKIGNSERDGGDDVEVNENK